LNWLCFGFCVVFGASATTEHEELVREIRCGHRNTRRRSTKPRKKTQTINEIEMIQTYGMIENERKSTFPSEDCQQGA